MTISEAVAYNQEHSTFNYTVSRETYAEKIYKTDLQYIPKYDSYGIFVDIPNDSIKTRKFYKIPLYIDSRRFYYIFTEVI